MHGSSSLFGDPAFGIPGMVFRIQLILLGVAFWPDN